MCIIVTKEKGIEMPSMDILKNCFVNNDDGAGFAYDFNKRVIIKKGFMTWEEFKTAVEEIEDKKNKSIVFHFRITTHGGSIAGNTHPFPITDKTKILQTTFVSTDIAMAHNGIISSVNTMYNSKVSDTIEFITEQVSIMKKIDKQFYLNENFQELLLNLSSSKLSFINGEGIIVNLGTFYEENGVYYSNTGYKTAVTALSALKNKNNEYNFTENEYVCLRTLPEDALITISGHEFFNDYYEYLVDEQNMLYGYSDAKYEDVEACSIYDFCPNYSWEDLKFHKESTKNWYVYNKQKDTFKKLKYSTIITGRS